MFTLDIYELMLENDETWYIYSSGSAFIMNDCALLDV